MTQTEIFYDLIIRCYPEFFKTKEHKDLQEEVEFDLIRTDHEYKMRCVAEAMLLYRMQPDEKALELLRKPQIHF